MRLNYKLLGFGIIAFSMLSSSLLYAADEEALALDTQAQATDVAAQDLLESSSASPISPSASETLQAPGVIPAEIVQEPEQDKLPSAPSIKEKIAGDLEEDEGPLTLKPGHRLLIRIYPEDEYVKGGEMEVSAEGNITLPLVGKVSVGGKKIAETEKDIAKLIDADYLVNPEVSIELKREKENQPISNKNFVILGQVRKPGTYMIPLEAKKFTLLQAISIGGGFTEIANSKRVKVVRKNEKDRQTMQINVEDIFNGSAPDMEVQSGDVIHVPESIF